MNNQPVKEEQLTPNEILYNYIFEMNTAINDSGNIVNIIRVAEKYINLAKTVISWKDAIASN